MKKAFTLAEMLVVFLILGILTIVGVFSYQNALRKGEIAAFISEVQSGLTPSVYGQGAVRASSYADLASFRTASLAEYTPSTSANIAGVRGILVQGNTISLYRKAGSYSKTQYGSFAYSASGGDTIYKTITIPPGVVFDSVCFVSDSHANCEATATAGTQLQQGVSLAYHGSNERPYAFFASSTGTDYYSGRGIRLSFKTPLQPLWYTITLSPYGGMVIGRACTTQVCL
ncbi:MAG TPA: type II secretion system protein [Candidatus Paceibacterota bacterium]